MKKITYFTGPMLAIAAFAAHAMPGMDFSYQYSDTYREVCGTDNEDDGCAEISAYDPVSGRIFTTNGTGNSLRILNLASSGSLSSDDSLDLSTYGAAPNSVAVAGGVVAVAMEAENSTDVGNIVIFDAATGSFQRTLTAGVLPDMVTFTPDGAYLLVANEGEPSDDYLTDPEGSISIISTADWSVRTADFTAFNDGVAEGVRVFGPGASVAQDLEPEYITVSSDSSTAFVALQENNALAVVDIASASVTDIKALGLKDHSLDGNALDASNRDGGESCAIPLAEADECINIQNWPVFGMYQPDAIATLTIDGVDYIVSANEGDARDYDGFSEELRIGDDEYSLDGAAFPDAATLKDDAFLGRLKTTSSNGDTDADGDVDQMYAYGARSFSIWTANGDLVFDSGDAFERKLSELQQAGVDVWTDSRSDDKGPEPESVTIGTIGGTPIAFIGLERISGIMVYDVGNPASPTYLGYINSLQAGDISPEGLVYVPVSDNGGNLIVTNEVSNTTSIYRINFSSGETGGEGSDSAPMPIDGPLVDGNTISWADDGWYQVQSATTFETICEGGNSCTVPAGVYHVINHSTGERWEFIEVGAIGAPPGSAPLVDGNTIFWADDGWYQVQSATTFESICEGGNSCAVSPGTYIVINHTTGTRYPGIVVGAGTPDTPVVEPMAQNGAIVVPDDGWYQVQSAVDFVSFCEGQLVCNVEPGEYIVINHTTGTRYFVTVPGNSGGEGGGGSVDVAFEMQLLHAADMDGTSGALSNVQHFSALVEHFRATMPDNTLTLSSGDNYIPGPRFFAAADDSLAALLGVAGNGRADIAFLNAMGFQASAVGNHELDLGTSSFASIFSAESGENGSDYAGAAFPYLSSNLDFAADENLLDLVAADAQDASAVAGKLARSTIVSIGGERIGVVGATTPSLAAITSAGGIGIAPEDASDIDALAASIQSAVEELIVAGIDKIVLLSHMQQIDIERSLATRLEGVDIIVAGGSNTLLADENDTLRTGDVAAGTYPETYR
ncbi:MAG: choice-of-anchor I family protein, partial [Granulosicoccus sp.]|nr:choice-of-anchor I family protein [Granulosicoccus sp.]